MYEQSERYRILAERSATSNSRDVPKEHEELQRAVIKRDITAACTLVAQHFWATTNIILEAGVLFAPLLW